MIFSQVSDDSCYQLIVIVLFRLQTTINKAIHTYTTLTENIFDSYARSPSCMSLVSILQQSSNEKSIADRYGEGRCPKMVCCIHDLHGKMLSWPTSYFTASFALCFQGMRRVYNSFIPFLSVIVQVAHATPLSSMSLNLNKIHYG